MQSYLLPIFVCKRVFKLFRALFVDHCDVAVAVIGVEGQVVLLVRRVVRVGVLLLSLTHRPFDAVYKWNVVRQLGAIRFDNKFIGLQILNNVLRHLVSRVVEVRVPSLHFLEMVLALNWNTVAIQIEVLLREPLFDLDRTIVLGHIIGTLLVYLIVVSHPYALS